MLAVWQDVYIIHEFHHLSGHRLSLCDWQEGSHFIIHLCCGSFFPDLQTAYVSRVFFLLQPRFDQRHAFHVDSSGTEPSWGDNDTTPCHLPPPKVLLNVVKVVQTLRDHEAKGGNDAWSKGNQGWISRMELEYLVMMCNFLSLGDCGLLHLLDSVWY